MRLDEERRDAEADAVCFLNASLRRSRSAMTARHVDLVEGREHRGGVLRFDQPPRDRLRGASTSARALRCARRCDLAACRCDGAACRCDLAAVGATGCSSVPARARSRSARPASSRGRRRPSPEPRRDRRRGPSPCGAPSAWRVLRWPLGRPLPLDAGAAAGVGAGAGAERRRLRQVRPRRRSRRRPRAASPIFTSSPSCRLMLAMTPRARR